MAVKKPDTQTRERYLRQQMREVHETIDELRSAGHSTRELPPMYIRAHKLRDMLDDELERLEAEAGDGDDDLSPEEQWAELVEGCKRWPRDMWHRFVDEVEGPALRVVDGEG